MVGAIIVVFLDEIMVKYGLTSGINLFIAGGVAYSIISGTVIILIPEALGALTVEEHQRCPMPFCFRSAVLRSDSHAG